MMASAVQIKIMIVILAVALVAVALLRRGGDSIPVSVQDQELQKKLAQKTQPSSHRFLVP